MIWKSLSYVSGMTLLSRLTGFFREILMAHFFGAGLITDTLTLAIKLPSYFRRIFAEGAFHATFVPLYTPLVKRNASEAHTFAGHIFQSLTGMILLITLGIFGLLPWVGPKFFGHFSPERYTLTLYMIQVMFPFLLWITWTAFFSALLNVHGFFGFAASSAVVGNLFICGGLGLITLTPYAISALPWIFLGSGVCQCFWVGVPIFSRGLIPQSFLIKRPPPSPHLRPFLRRFVPTALSFSSYQLAGVINIWLGARLSKGLLSCLHYADRLYQLPLSLIGTALGTVLLPTLSKHPTKTVFHYQALVCGLTLSASISLVLFFFSTPLVAWVYHHGAFSYPALQATSEALKIYSLGLPAHILTKILTVICFSQHDTKTPTRISLISLLCDVGLSLGLMPFYHHKGLALALVISGWISVLGFFLMHPLVFFRRHGLSLRPLGEATVCTTLFFLWNIPLPWMLHSGLGLSLFFGWLYYRNFLSYSTLKGWFT